MNTPAIRPAHRLLQRLGGVPLRILLFGLWLAGCTVGPDYQRPEAGVPETFRHLQTASTSVALLEDDEPESPGPSEPWWTSFNDPQLNRLVEEALQGNLDLEAAKTRIRASRAAFRATGSAGRPQLGAGLAAQRLGLSDNAPDASSRRAALGFGGAETDLFELGFDAGWEIDLFGAVRRSSEAASARYDMAVESALQPRVSH